MQPLISSSPQETESIAKRFAKKLSKGSVVSLVGELGSGKTTFVKGMAMGLGTKNPTLVTSPTFILIVEYEGVTPLYHFDLYRIHHEQELEGLGLDEYFEGEGVSVVEWGNRFPHWLPPSALTVMLEAVDETTRKIVLPFAL